MNAIRVRLAALVFAAIGGAATYQLNSVDVFAWIALVSFVVALAAETVILILHPEERWYEGRAGAESVKTLTWRFAVCGDPFPGQDDASERDRFLRQLTAVSTDLSHFPTPPPTTGEQTAVPNQLATIRSEPFVDRRDRYVSGRIVDQIEWYSRKARRCQKMQIVFLLLTVAIEFLGIVGAALRISGAVSIDALGILAAIAAGIASWSQTRQYGQLSRAYSIAAHELIIIKVQCEDATEAEWPRLIDESEEAISREHTLWRASRGVLGQTALPKTSNSTDN